jgi:hypothetical protein
LLPVALVLSFALVALDLGFRRFGIPADEAGFHEATRLHVEWVRELGRPGAFDAETLRRHFPWTPNFGVVHPAFSRLLSGLGLWLGHDVLGLDELVSLRLYNALAWAAIAAGVFVVARRRGGQFLACFAVLSLWADVRFFGHTHTAMTDVLLSALWLWATILCADGLAGARRGRLFLAALLAGLALATKLTGVILLATLLFWVIWIRRRRALPAVLLFLAVPALVFYVLTPGAWRDPLTWTADFLAGFRAREDIVSIPTLFLGVRYGHQVPWYVPLVHAAITTPPLLLGLCAVASAATLRRTLRRGRESLRQPWVLFTLAALGPLLATCLPAVPAHDLERLFLPLHPFLVLGAAAGFQAVVGSETFTRWTGALLRGRPGMARWLAAAVLLGPALVEAARQYPYCLTYFNVLVGGTSGAERLGFDVAYLKLEVNGEVLDALEEHVEPGARLFANFVYRDLENAQAAGRLDPEIRLVDRGPADYAILYARRGWMSPPEEKVYLERPPPVWSLRHRGVDLVLLYRMEDLAEGGRRRAGRRGS